MSAISDIKAKIGAAVSNKGALPRILGKRFADMYDYMDEVINENLDWFGELIVTYAKEHMEMSVPSGRRYAYVEYDKTATGKNKRKILFEWTASSTVEIPAMLEDRTLLNNIEYKVEEVKYYGGLASLSIGVFSNELGGAYPTVAFRGPDPHHGIFTGQLIVIPNRGMRTSVKEYAEKLNERHPFLSDIFQHAIKRAKNDFRKRLKEEFNSAMGRKTKKLPVTFKIYVRGK